MPEEQLTSGITEDLIRLSIGLEDINDLLYYLDKALTESVI
ncbi:PLP-dependent transferase [Pelosinus fermentans]|nr:PLP-dependent transferase [Pelosinus fermentans]